MFNIKRTKTEKNSTMRLTFLYLFALELGAHYLNGTHLQIGVGVGPLELSTSLHHWDNW